MKNLFDNMFVNETIASDVKYREAIRPSEDIIH